MNTTKSPANGSTGLQCSTSSDATMFVVPDEPLRVALYTRHASGSWKSFATTEPTQGERLHAFCRARGWTVVAEFEDIGVRELPGQRAVIREARSNARRFDAVVVESFSRVARVLAQIEEVANELRGAGVLLISMTEEMQGEPSLEDSRRFIAIFEEYSSREAGKHVSRAMMENARQGFFNGGRPPYGYEAVAAIQRGNVVKKMLQLNSVEANTVMQMYGLVLFGRGGAGPMGVSQVAEWLNRSGSFTRNGGNWTRRAVRRLLKDPVYTGEYCYNRKADPKERILVRVPAIVPVGVFHMVQRRI